MIYTLKLTPEMRIRLAYAETLSIDIEEEFTANLESRIKSVLEECEGLCLDSAHEREILTKHLILGLKPELEEIS